MSIKLIENLDNPSELAKEVLTRLEIEDDDEMIEYSIRKDWSHTILCIVKDMGIILSLDCRDINKSIVSYDSDSIVPDDYTDPDDFFKCISKIDRINDTLRHIWQDFTSIISDIKGDSI